MNFNTSVLAIALFCVLTSNLLILNSSNGYSDLRAHFALIALLYVLRRVRNIKLIVVSSLPLERSHLSYLFNHVISIALNGISNLSFVKTLSEL